MSTNWGLFYKADAPNVNSIKLTELTISYISSRYPREMIRHLRKERGYVVELKERGIYQVHGDIIPIQNDGYYHQGKSESI